MRKLGLRLLILLYWVIGRGPWLVVGHYTDDEGRACRFRTGGSTPDGRYVRTFDDLDEAKDYAYERNEQAFTDPLGTVYYVWHELEFNYFYSKEKR